MEGKVLGAVLALAGMIAVAVFGGIWGENAVPREKSPRIFGEVIPGIGATRAPEGPDPLEADILACGKLAETMEAEHVFVYDCAAKRMLCCTSDADARVYPASITKLFTAWGALQVLSEDAVITVEKDALALVDKGSSLALLAPGHRLRVEQLVEAMLLPSGNDAAWVLAAAAGRELAGEKLPAAEAAGLFLEKLEEMARSIGAENTHFSTPDGYHRDTHVSTPVDLAILGAAAAENPLIRRYSTCFADTVVFESGQRITWYNTNRLSNPEDSFYEPSMVAGKTGYTGEAGCCLLAVAEKNGRRILVGIFGAKDRTRRYAYANGLLDALGI